MLFNKAYYFAKPVIPWQARIAVRRIWAAKHRAANSGEWPIDEAAGVAPPGWPGWPEGRQFALVLTHDVESVKGLRRIERLMALERRLGFRSSFNLVPGEEYEVSDQLIRTLDESGFEVGVHGLEHDGKLYNSKARFGLKASGINSYIERWGAQGFRSPLMQHRLGWLHRLNVEYDSSTFDTDPFEPEPDGVKTIFPFWVPGPDGSGFVELPYTLAQDFTLFVVLREANINVWKEKLDWIARRGGMAMLITHPDYMCFDGDQRERDEAPASFYEEFLTYVREKYNDRYWPALPRDVNRFYRASVPAGTRNTRKRICIVAHTQYENDSRTRRYAESLACRGDIVDVIALRSSQSGTVYDLKGVNVYGIQDRANQETGKLGYAWRRLRFLYSSFVFASRRHSLMNYDLVHVCCNGPSFLVFAALYPKWTGSKVILDIHDIEPEDCRGYFKSRPHNGYTGIQKIVRRLSTAFFGHVTFPGQLREARHGARSMSDEKCSTSVEPEASYLSLIDSLCAERFESADSVGSDPDVPLEPRVLRRPPGVQIIDENLPVPHPDKDVP